MRGSSFLGSLVLATTRQVLATKDSSSPNSHGRYCSVFIEKRHPECLQVPDAFVNFYLENHNITPPSPDILEDAYSALVVLQRDYFDAEFGVWPEAIDWTAAVAGTVVTGMLSTLSKSLGVIDLGGVDDLKGIENLISSYYAQIVASYFGQDILSIRGQAYDDILWVVLAWVEALRFVSAHSDLHYPGQHDTDVEGLKAAMESLSWHGNYWNAQFAHRSRVFWDLAKRGWDDKLCHGGMLWNPRLTPYKNAITNELWISASIAMYQYFPGDDFMSPWSTSATFPENDPAHLAAAVEGYRWLKNVNMTNSKGLFVDGFHISTRAGNRECDLRDEMVYSYNQGVVLTGQRGLWAVTGSASYLEEGHELIQAVIRATGWDLKRNTPLEDLDRLRPDRLPPWYGLGRGGIMEEQCDASGTCSQDSQTFKGIFFHHFTTFCEELELPPAATGYPIDIEAYHRVKRAHTAACTSYVGWVRHNALAALGTKDDSGQFGMWWGAGVFKNVLVTPKSDGINHAAANTTDYRNQGTPDDITWGRHDRWVPGSVTQERLSYHDLFYNDPDTEHVLGQARRVRPDDHAKESIAGGQWMSASESRDPNARGRGRRLETQVGGLALLRAYWELSQLSAAD